MGFCETIGAHTEAMTVCRRRLEIPGISTYERMDTLGGIAVIHFLIGDYEQSIAMVCEALDALRPGEPVEYLAQGVSIAMWAAYVAGQWDSITPLLDALGKIWERLQLRPGAGAGVFDGYMSWLLIAKAREDRPSIDMASSVIERMYAEESSIKEFIAIIHDDQLDRLDIEKTATGVTGLILSWFSEAGMKPPAKLMLGTVFQNDMTTWSVQIAQALLDDDNTALASAIDAAEAHGLVVHAARMRIVLAQRSSDRAQLDRARPVLERLNDRRSLRRLEEVEALLA